MKKSFKVRIKRFDRFERKSKIIVFQSIFCRKPEKQINMQYNDEYGVFLFFLAPTTTTKFLAQTITKVETQPFKSAVDALDIKATKAYNKNLRSFQSLRTYGRSKN